MSRPIIMLPHQWQAVLDKIKQREKPSVYLSSSKMKDVMGFSVRHHREYVKDIDYVRPPEDGSWFNMVDLGWYEGKHSEYTVRLDFYDEQKRTMFLLKYGNGKD